MIAGLQTIATGLIGELLVSQTGRREDIYSIAEVLERPAAKVARRSR